MTIQTDPQYKLRMPPELHRKLKNAAAENHRSMNAEIVARLEESFATKGEEVALGQMTVHEFLEEQRTTLKQHLEMLERLQRGEE